MSYWKEIGNTFIRAAIITFVTAVFAILVNFIHPRKIPFFAKYPYEIYTDCPEVVGNVKKISLEDLEKILKAQSLIYVDARDGESYRAGHIPQAWHIPYSILDQPDPEQINRLKGQVKTTIIVYGDGLEESDCGCLLASDLISLGLSNVYCLQGGIARWQKAGRPLDK